MTSAWLTDQFLYCCLSPAQQEKLAEDLAQKQYRTPYLLQENLTKEKTGYRCRVCGKFYPFLQIEYRDSLTDPKAVSRTTGGVSKFKKAALSFFPGHYYTQKGKTFLKFEPDAAENIHPVHEIPIMGGVYHTILSPDERFIATETFSGTIAVTDLLTKQALGKKQKRSINGAFSFTPGNCLLYFFGGAIRCWDFAENTDRVLWTVPEAWKTVSPGARVVCSNVIYNRKEKTHWFQLWAGNTSYAVIIKDFAPVRVVPLPEAPALRKLVYNESQDLYTLPCRDGIAVLDSLGQLIEILPCPRLLSISDGGGRFPIVRHMPAGPRRAFLSPDGAWMLLDYFTALILMKQQDASIQFCQYSATGKTAGNMGFTDCRHFWYAWGDTTYVQELPEMSGKTF